MQLFYESTHVGLKTPNRTKTPRIVDETGREVSIPEARRAWESGEVQGYNVAFGRLARDFHFDVEKLEEHYDARKRRV